MDLSAIVTVYGATGDGHTDDSAAIRAAILAAGPGGRVVFPGGHTYTVSRDGARAYCLAPLPGQTWEGYGTATIRLADGQPPETSVIRVEDAPNVRIVRLTVDGNHAAQSVEAQPQRHCIIVNRSPGFTLTDCTLADAAGDGLLLWRATDRVRVRASTITGHRRNGISLVGSGHNLTFDSLSITGCAAQSFDGEMDTSGTFSAVRITNSHLGAVGSGQSVGLTGLSAASPLRDWTFTACHIEGEMIGAYIDGVTVRDCRIDSTAHPTRHCFATQQDAANVRLIDNEMVTSGVPVVLIERSGDSPVEAVTVSGNQIIGGGITLNGVDGVTVTHNRMTATGTVYAGITVGAVVNSLARPVVVSDNETSGYTRGVQLTAVGVHSMAAVRIADNHRRGDQLGYGVAVDGAAANFPSLWARGNEGGTTALYCSDSATVIKT